MGTLKKKDFEKIAKLINTYEKSLNQNGCTLSLFVSDLCEYLKTTNGQFKEKEFKALCGVQDE
jgi:hypothetical protein